MLAPVEIYQRPARCPQAPVVRMQHACSVVSETALLSPVVPASKLYQGRARSLACWHHGPQPMVGLQHETAGQTAASDCISVCASDESQSTA